MELTELTLPPEIWAATPAAAQTVIIAQRERIRELEARLGQGSANSSRPPSSDPPQAPVRPKAPPSGRKRGGQPGHRGVFRRLLPVERVDEIVAVVPERCRHCEQSFPEPTPRHRGRVWRHQVVELLPLAVRVTEYQMAAVRLLTVAGTCRPPGRPLLDFLVAAGEAALQGTASPSLLPALQGN
jgi:transposase